MQIYPECDKARKIAHFSQKIGEFLDWLEIDKRICLMEDRGPGDEDGFRYYHTLYSKERLLAEFFDIDLDKWEEEKRAILKKLQSNGTI